MNKQILSMLVTGTVLLSTLAPAVLADTQLSITGNGADSTSNVTSTSGNTQTVVQNNSAHVTNDVSSNSNTGNNHADENTGGNVTVDTGNAVNTTDVSTRANANFADLGCTSCNSGATSVTVSGNGFNSDNTARVNNANSSSLFQQNTANVDNNVTSNAQTGDNNANRNTGGDVLVLTGHAANGTSVQTAVNANTANLSGATGNGDSSSDIWVVGNGAYSNNSVTFDSRNSLTAVQGNNAQINNRVNSDANTGRNNANENTGGNVTVDTGNALNSTDVATLANFNSADLSNCGCTTAGLLEKVAGNGAYSRNNVNANNADTMSVFQGGHDGNLADIANWVNANGATGDSSANQNTASLAGYGIDPVDVISGHSTSDTAVSTKTNMNVLGPHFQLPDGSNVDFTFDLNGLLNMF